MKMKPLAIAQSLKSTRRYRWSSLVLGVAFSLLAAIPVRAAERLVFAFHQLEFYLPVSSLKTFAKDGTVDKDLGSFFGLLKLNPEAQALFRSALVYTNKDNEEAPLRKPYPASQVLYSPIGVSALRNLGIMIQTSPNQNGFYAMRSAIILSAADPEGLSLLGIMIHFPTKNIRIDLSKALQLSNRRLTLSKLTDETDQLIEAQAQKEAAAEGPVNPATLPPVQVPGPYQFTKQTLELTDSRRNNRPVPTDVYIPDFKGNPPASIPVVVFSHGLGETRTFMEPALKLLASYGFVAAAPEHIGSDKGQQERLLGGAASEIFQNSEFYNRPLDVSFVLDTLEQKNSTEFGGRLNLKQVGAFGHSFGGYTVLVLGGATVDFKRLRKECESDYLVQSVNVSLLLQCRALELESSPQAALLTSGQLQDPRVKGVIAISPVTSAILGQSGLNRVQVPVMLVGGGKDPAAPLVPEQTQAFNWLTEPDRYLVSAKYFSHTPDLAKLINRITLPGVTTDELDERLELFLKNMREVGLAFMQVYAAGRAEYRPYLTPSYVQSLLQSSSVQSLENKSDVKVRFNLIRSFPPDQLEQILRQLP